MLTYDTIAREIKEGKLRPAYLLSGDEPYFIDKLTELFLQKVIPEDERDFNLTVLYGNDKNTQVSLIASDVMRFPMMGEHHLVLVKEAQQINDIESLGKLLPELPETTCLVLCYKKKADKRKALYKSFMALDGSILESNPIAERDVPRFITSLLQAKNLSIDAHTAALMSEHTGNNLEKINGEVEKLSIVLPSGGSVTPDVVELHIGISKEYNNFELLSALINRQDTKAYRIAYHFAKNEKNYPIQMTIAILFNYFSTLMGGYYLAQKDERSLAQGLGLSPYMVRDYVKGMQHYSAGQVYQIIRHIRMADAYSKGVGANMPSGEILKQLVSSILTQ